VPKHQLNDLWRARVLDVVAGESQQSHSHLFDQIGRNLVGRASPNFVGQLAIITRI
jgi:hypothetical protein